MNRLTGILDNDHEQFMVVSTSQTTRLLVILTDVRK
jgi:hypothetical protein